MGREIEYLAPIRKHVSWTRLLQILEGHKNRIAEEKRLLSWELRLEKRIREAGFKCSAFDGITTHDERKVYFRSIITMNKLGDKPCGKTTFAGAFAMTYREEL